MNDRNSEQVSIKIAHLFKKIFYFSSEHRSFVFDGEIAANYQLTQVGVVIVLIDVLIHRLIISGEFNHFINEGYLRFSRT
jgi:hypothetical protein